MNDKDIESLLEKIKQEAINETETLAKKYKDSAIEDINQFASYLKESLKLWTEQLEEGKLSIKDFEFLIKGQKDLIQMFQLKQKGLAQVKIDELKESIFIVIIKNVEELMGSLI